MNRLLHIFWDTDMRLGHVGLTEVAKKKGIKVPELPMGEMVCFINRKRDRIMVLSGTGEADSFGVLGYYRSPHGRVDEMAIQYIPKAFGAGGLNMNKAIKEALLKRLAKRDPEKATDG